MFRRRKNLDTNVVYYANAKSMLCKALLGDEKELYADRGYAPSRKMMEEKYPQIVVHRTGFNLSKTSVCRLQFTELFWLTKVNPTFEYKLGDKKCKLADIFVTEIGHFGHFELRDFRPKVLKKGINCPEKVQ